MSRDLDSIFLKARAAEKRGDKAGALDLYRSILARFPNNVRAQRAAQALAQDAGSPSPDQVNALIALYQSGQLAALVEQANALRARFPQVAIVERLLGAGQIGMGRLAEAEAAFARALAIEPGDAQTLFNHGVVLQEQGRLDQAVDAYRRSLAIQPGQPAARFNLGNALLALGRADEAVTAYREAVAQAPTLVAAWYNLGHALTALDRPGEALAAHDQALAIEPGHAGAHDSRGLALQALRRPAEAIDAHRAAIAADPASAEAHNNLGNALRDTGRPAEAVEAFERAIALAPALAEAHNNLGNALRDLGEVERAIASYDRALALVPDWSLVRAQKLYQQAQICDWSAFTEFAAIADRLGIETAVPPFALLAFEDAPDRQLLRSRRWAEATYKPAPACPHPAPSADGRIRIGYFSADFHDHATMFLMAGLFRHHDRRRFAIHVYSYGAERQGMMREALVGQVDHFEDVEAMPDDAIARLARDHGLDIAVDLKGYTTHHRVGLFAHRPAPVQISFLGYPGSLGAGFMDYLVADPVVLPEAERGGYDEAILRLPHSYQPNDDRRAIAPDAGTRADHGLPETGFVFCCFNAGYKIGPAAFDIWMRLLDRVEGSVLWLLRSNGFVEANLRREAAARGIDPTRLVFAERRPLSEHLARHAHADLFLDSFAYNAHTTMSDALWAGLPAITLAGRQFAARVGASLLQAVGLPELIIATAQDYEALALDLATTPAKLAAIRERLKQQRQTSPLFDPALFARHIEAGYAAAHQRLIDGLSPADIQIEP